MKNLNEIVGLKFVTRKTKMVGTVKKVVLGVAVVALLSIIGYQNWVYHNMLKISKAQQGTVATLLDDNQYMEAEITECSLTINTLEADVNLLENPNSKEAKDLKAEIDSQVENLWTTTTTETTDANGKVTTATTEKEGK